MTKEQRSENFKYIIRVSNTDLDGEKAIIDSLRKIRGVSFSFANAICHAAGIEKRALTGNLTDDIVEKIQAVVNDPASANIPTWMYNRQRDYDTGSDKHLLMTDLLIQNEDDQKRLKKIKSYRGLRLQAGLPVRGQRTQSNFRKNKGKR